MSGSNEQLIRLLEAELDFIEAGGYQPSAGEPRQEKPMFYHSLVCINHWLVPGHESECHDNCVLLDAVPPEYRAQDLPCHFIPLNEAGDTVADLQKRGDRERLEEEVKHWLRAAIARLRNTPGSGTAPGLTY